LGSLYRLNNNEESAFFHVGEINRDPKCPAIGRLTLAAENEPANNKHAATHNPGRRILSALSRLRRASV
jgi:hypothetical protein